MTTYNSASVAGKKGAVRATDYYRAPSRIFETVAVSSLATSDVVNVGYLPRNAVVTGATLKTDGQLDSNGSPTLAFNMGVTGTANLFKAAITTVGRSSGATADATIAAGGLYYKNTSGAPLLVTVTASTGAATGAAANLTCEVSYFVDDAAGSQA